MLTVDAAAAALFRPIRWSQPAVHATTAGLVLLADAFIVSIIIIC